MDIVPKIVICIFVLQFLLAHLDMHYDLGEKLQDLRSLIPNPSPDCTWTGLHPFFRHHFSTIMLFPLERGESEDLQIGRWKLEGAGPSKFGWGDGTKEGFLHIPMKPFQRDIAEYLDLKGPPVAASSIQFVAGAQHFQFVLFDGEYSNHLDVVQLESVLSSESETSSHDEVAGVLYKFEDFSLQEKLHCSFRLTVLAKDDIANENPYGYELSPSSKAVTKGNQTYVPDCIGPRQKFVMRAHSQTYVEHMSFVTQIQTFSIGAVLVMAFFLLTLKGEDRLFTESVVIRYWGMVPHGEESLTYASKISLFSNVYIFLQNFCSSLVYCQICETSDYTLIFLLPLIMQLCILFGLSKMIGLQLRVLATDSYATSSEQNTWLTLTQIKIYTLAVLFVAKVNLIYFKWQGILLCLASTWVPQIWRNTKRGFKFTPNWNYALAQTFQALFVPLYFKANPANCLRMEPRPIASGLLAFWALLQLVILWIQRSKPRFLLPKSLRKRILPDFYDYERVFDEEASRKSVQSKFSSKDFKDDHFEPVSRFDKTLGRLLDKECAVCLLPLGDQRSDRKAEGFFQTPCKHDFHPACLQTWMEQGKQTCPLCRERMPEYYSV